MRFTNVIRLICGFLFFLSINTVMAGGVLLQFDTTDSSIYHEKKWPNTGLPINWYLNQDGYPDSGINNTALQQLFLNAFTTWENVPTSQVTFNYAGESELSNVGLDGINLVTFSDQDFEFEPGTMANALLYTFVEDTTIDDNNNDLNDDGIADLVNGLYAAGTIYEVDIVFNTSYVFDNSGVNSSLDLQAVATHEIGHLLGLSHSVIDDAVMYPFLSSDISNARTLKYDDVAYLSKSYPAEPLFSDTTGTITGSVNDGYSNNRVLGAHVFAFDPGLGKKIIGSYSLGDGEYVLPGIPTSNYIIGIEPLDKVPAAANPQLINEVIANTLDTNFHAEFYDSNESNIETNSDNAEPISIVAGSKVDNINFITNTLDVPGVSLILEAGLNLFSYPVSTSIGFTAFDLLKAIGPASEVNSLEKYNHSTGRYERASWLDNDIAGVNFDIKRGEAYLLHMKIKKAITFKGDQDCSTVDLHKGFNLIGVPCPPYAYTAFSALKQMGTSVVKIARYRNDGDALSVFETATFDDAGEPVGIDFPIANGEGYIVETLTTQGDISLPGTDQVFPPYIIGISPGRAVAGSEITILGEGFSNIPAMNEVNINEVRASVIYATTSSLTVKVPSTASSGLVNVTLGDKKSNDVEFIVANAALTEEEALNKDLIDQQTVLGSLDIEGEQDRYSFVATKGSFVSVSATSVVAGVPDLFLAIESPTGGVLISDNNSGGGTNALISQYEIQETGRYTVVVSSVLNTGLGQYNLSINIESRSSKPEISVIKGGYQTGVRGSRLPEDLEILVTGQSGQPVSGALVTITTDNGVTVSESFTAATYNLVSNSSGIVQVSVELPNIDGDYIVDIKIPGYDVKRIQFSSLSRLPSKIIVEGDTQCIDVACNVGELLAESYKLTFLDADDSPVEGVLVKFHIVSGGGEFETGLFNKEYRNLKTDASGVVQVRHRLGKYMFDKRTSKPVYQIVSAVANTANSLAPILFTPNAKAGPATTVESLKSSSFQMMVHTTRYNAIYIYATDEFGNPAANQDVLVTTNDFSFSGGYFDGAPFAEMKTNKDGLFVLQLTADKSGPTINEFGHRFPTKEDPYIVTVGVGSTSLNFNVDLHLGPELIATTGLGNIGLGFGESIWVGQRTNKPLLFELVRWQRDDSCRGVFKDEDSGDWTNERDISLDELIKIPTIQNPNALGLEGKGATQVAYSHKIYRADGIVEPTPVIANIGLVDFDERHFEYYRLLISGGHAKGEIHVDATANVTLGWIHRATEYCYREHSDSEYKYKAVAHGLGIPLPDPPFDVRWACLHEFGESYACDGGNAVIDSGSVEPVKLSASFSFNIISPKIEIDISEAVLSEPNPDNLKILPSDSGIDVSKYEVELNTKSIFNFASISPTDINSYPNYVQIETDGYKYDKDSSISFDEYFPRTFKFIYYPTADELLTAAGEENIIFIKKPEDKAGNIGESGEEIFTFPPL